MKEVLEYSELWEKEVPRPRCDVTCNKSKDEQKKLMRTAPRARARKEMIFQKMTARVFVKQFLVIRRLTGLGNSELSLLRQMLVLRD